MTVPPKGRATLTHALVGLAMAAAAWFTAHAVQAPPAAASPPSEVAALQRLMEWRFDQLDKRLDRLERAQDARAIPASGR